VLFPTNNSNFLLIRVYLYYNHNFSLILIRTTDFFLLKVVFVASPGVVGGAGLISGRGVGTRHEHGFELVVDGDDTARVGFCFRLVGASLFPPRSLRFFFFRSGLFTGGESKRIAAFELL
jgi:hypothetical protein